jgi:hypothetical protein
MKSMAKIITAAPATLLTTLPIITGVGVAGAESDCESFPDAAVLEDVAPEIPPVPPPINAPASVDVGCGDKLGE